jgi:hypothetical protein
MRVRHVGGCYDAALRAFREAGLTEVGRFGADRMAVDEGGIPCKDEERCQPGWHHVSLADTEVGQFELFELSCFRHTCQPDSKIHIWCMVFGQETAMQVD